MSLSRQGSGLHIIELLYLVLAAFSFYLLTLSRTGEAQTVWRALHPFFIPTLFVTTFALLTILFTSDKTAHKLFFIIIYSVIIHSFFSIIFPAGDLSGQQMVLGRTRRVFDNTILHGWTDLPTQTVQVVVYEMFQGVNLQAALSTVFARMLNVDIFYVHLFLVPVLWGVFVPIAAFLTTKALSGSDNASVLSSLLVSAFPYTIYFGAISVPNSLGFIFFFYSLYFMLKYLTSKDSKTAYWMLIFTFFSFLSHSLTGIMSLSLLLLATVFKAYRVEKKSSPTTAKISLIAAFLVCASLLPLSFIYLRFFNPSASTIFTLDKFYESSVGEFVGVFLFGLAYGFDIKNIFLLTIGPTIALLWMLYLLYRLKRNPMDKFGECIQFLFGAYLIMLIDYRILNLFMSGLPINEERLWVLRDFIAAPFAALAVFAVVSSLKASLKAKLSPATLTAILKPQSKGNVLRVLSLLFVLNVLIPVGVGGWITFSMSAAYPRIAPLQTTTYELGAVRYIEENTRERYVVIGDIWAIYAGEMIVGINNPRAYYFAEFSKTGHDLFVNMTKEPSSKWMLLAMNHTDTTVAYFIITEPRLGTQEFNNIVSKALQNGLRIYGPPEGFGNGKLYIFRQEKT